VTCIDLSNEMVNLCQEKGLNAHVMDFYDLQFPDQSFDAVFALNCLLHVPKANLESVLKEVHRVLRDGGLFFCGVYGGQDTEGIWEMVHRIFNPFCFVNRPIKRRN
jgi:ubiquinone/menaquinone biosynthesis C-methylase UbiE